MNSQEGRLTKERGGKKRKKKHKKKRKSSGQATEAHKREPCGKATVASSLLAMQVEAGGEDR